MGEAWHHWRGELKAVLAVGAVLMIVIMIGYFRYVGSVTAETGEIVRFGSYATDLGNRPTAIVRTEDGRVNELMATPALLRGCSQGSRIRLNKRAYSLRIDPKGCR